MRENKRPSVYDNTTMWVTSEGMLCDAFITILNFSNTAIIEMIVHVLNIS